MSRLIDENGLDELDKKILFVLASHFHGKPVGVSTLAIVVGEEAETLAEVHEPFLIQEGYIQRTPQGRQLTPKGWQILQVNSEVQNWFS